MDIFLIILLILYFIATIISMKLDKEAYKRTKEILTYNMKLVKQQEEIVQILIDAKINNEQSYFTLEKIKNVLVSNCETDN